jgi:hypothetical protein
MDAYDRCTNLGEKKILPKVLPSMVEAENSSDHPCISGIFLNFKILPSTKNEKFTMQRIFHPSIHFPHQNLKKFF